MLTFYVNMDTYIKGRFLTRNKKYAYNTLHKQGWIVFIIQSSCIEAQKDAYCVYKKIKKNILELSRGFVSKVLVLVRIKKDAFDAYKKKEMILFLFSGSASSMPGNHHLQCRIILSFQSP